MTWNQDGRAIDIILEHETGILEHETGKVDLNIGDIALLERAVAGLFPGHAEAIIALVRKMRAERQLFWRVSDMLPPIERMGPSEAVARSHFTIYSSASGVSLMTAPPAVIRAIPRISGREAERVLDAQRTGAWSADIGSGLDGRYFTIERPVYRLRAAFRAAVERGADRAAIVAIDARYGTWRTLVRE